MSPQSLLCLESPGEACYNHGFQRPGIPVLSISPASRVTVAEGLDCTLGETLPRAPERGEQK